MPPHPGDELVDQAGPPWCPRRRPGGASVGFGEGGQQVQAGDVADLAGNERHGLGVVQVPAGRGVGQ